MRMMNFCKLPFAVLLFLLATFKLFFRHSFYHFFLCVLKNKIKNGIHADLCDSKAEMKVWYPWFVIRYFFGPRTVPEEPTLRHLCHPLRSDWLHERALGPTLPPRDIPRLSRKKKFSLWPYNKSFIDQVCSAKMAGYCPRSFLRFNFRHLCNFGRMHFL